MYSYKAKQNSAKVIGLTGNVEALTLNSYDLIIDDGNTSGTLDFGLSNIVLDDPYGLYIQNLILYNSSNITLRTTQAGYFTFRAEDSSDCTITNGGYIFRSTNITLTGLNEVYDSDTATVTGYSSYLHNLQNVTINATYSSVNEARSSTSINLNRSHVEFIDTTTVEANYGDLGRVSGDGTLKVSNGDLLGDIVLSNSDVEFSLVQNTGALIATANFSNSTVKVLRQLYTLSNSTLETVEDFNVTINITNSNVDIIHRFDEGSNIDITDSCIYGSTLAQKDFIVENSTLDFQLGSIDYNTQEWEQDFKAGAITKNLTIRNSTITTAHRDGHTQEARNIVLPSDFIIEDVVRDEVFHAGQYWGVPKGFIDKTTRVSRVLPFLSSMTIANWPVEKIPEELANPNFHHMSIPETLHVYKITYRAFNGSPGASGEFLVYRTEKTWYEHIWVYDKAIKISQFLLLGSVGSQGYVFHTVDDVNCNAFFDECFSITIPMPDFVDYRSYKMEYIGEIVPDFEFYFTYPVLAEFGKSIDFYRLTRSGRKGDGGVSDDAVEFLDVDPKNFCIQGKTPSQIYYNSDILVPVTTEGIDCDNNG